MRGTVRDATGARIAAASVIVMNEATSVRRGTLTDEEGTFRAQFLRPGRYQVQVSAPGMSPQERKGIVVELGSITELRLVMRVEGRSEVIAVQDGVGEVSSLNAEHAAIVDQQSIEDLPLNGRRFADLALLSTNIVPDTRGLTSDSNGDLSSGGIRGYQTSYLVDGADNNNGFFAQARGRYRAPYQLL